MAESVQPGVRVKVRFGGKDVSGFCIARRDRSEHDGDLTPLRGVVSPEVVLTPDVLSLATAVAQRWIGTVPDVLRLAVPPRHARVEQEVWPEVTWQPDAGSAPLDPPSPVWSDYPAVAAFLRRLAAGESPRAAWQALPAVGQEGWHDAVAQGVLACAASGRSALVVVPTEIGRASWRERV